jgi:hypothetical protein
VHPDADANHHQQDEKEVHHKLTDEIQQSPRPFKKSGKKTPKGSHVFSLSSNYLSRHHGRIVGLS